MQLPSDYVVVLLRFLFGMVMLNCIEVNFQKMPIKLHKPTKKPLAPKSECLKNKTLDFFVGKA
jgi:hypothetical protein